MDPITRRNFLAGAGAISAWCTDARARIRVSRKRDPSGREEAWRMRPFVWFSRPGMGYEKRRSFTCPADLRLPTATTAIPLGGRSSRKSELNKSGDGSLVALFAWRRS